MSTQQADLDSVRGSITALQAELGTELLSQLDPNDQREARNNTITCTMYMYSTLDVHVQYIRCIVYVKSSASTKLVYVSVFIEYVHVHVYTCTCT